MCVFCSVCVCVCQCDIQPLFTSPLPRRVDEMSSVNKMTAYNLSVVFAPTLMRSPSEDMSLVKDIPLQRHFVEMLILKHSVLFS